MEEQNSPVTFTGWLRQRRKALDMTQEELAQRVGCSVGALRKIESGERRPSKQLAVLIAQALEISNEDQQSFVRVARGELNFERLPLPMRESLTPFSDLQIDRRVSPAASPASKPTTASPSSHIPLQATSVIGRESELASLERLFQDSQCRLLTLTGIGGIGKTRLAIEFATRSFQRFPGGVFYIPLASINSSQKIVPAVADVLAFGFTGTIDPKEQLLSYIENNIKQDALFIFDNLEHLLGPTPGQPGETGVAELVAEFLGRLPGVKILATSREHLKLHGEWTFELHGLTVPPTDSFGRLEDYDSIALFMKCAQRIKVDFKVTPEDHPSVIRICQLVEGIPLAIELAAAWVGLLSCQEISQEIQINLDFLTTSMRDVPRRHRSIRATFDHSWNLLSEEERLVLSQLSVFNAGFDRAAARVVAGATLPLLASLSAKSLLRRTESGRYDLHEVIRQYALANLVVDPCYYETRDRYCEYYLAYLHGREASLKNAAQQEAVRQLTDEIDNIRAAWAWAIEQQEYARLSRAGRALGWYFEISGLYREGIEQLEPLALTLQATESDVISHRLLGLVLIHLALLYFRIGEFDRAQNLYEDGIAALRLVGDQKLLADGLIYLGIILHLKGDYSRAQVILEEGRISAGASNDRWLEAYAILNLGYLASLLGRFEEGCEQMLAGIAIWREIKDPQSIALGLNFLVPTLNALGRSQEARDFMHESIALCEKSRNRWGLGTAYCYLGSTSLVDGQYDRALAYLQKSLEIFGEDLVGWSVVRTVIYLAETLRLSGDLRTARRYYLDALRQSIESRVTPLALDALAGLGHLHAEEGNSAFALRLCTFILAHPASEAGTRNSAERLRAALEPRLIPEEIEKVGAEAGEITLEMIVTATLETG